MSKITDIIFKGEEHYITSKFGSRTPIKTSAGTTSRIHRGTDYGTNNKNLMQYAIEEGVVYSCGIDSDGAKYVTIKYPRINKRFIHWHLDSILVTKGQKVKKYTKIGTTGKTGKATGIHLHLGIIDLKSNSYIDPEEYAKTYTESSETVNKDNSFFPDKGYFSYGDNHVNVGKIASFMYKTFPAYTNKKALGNYYGANIKSSIKEFQRRSGLKNDGCVGPITLNELKKYGFKE
jgi:murein DD-endopeptidase MepM/ murein hydrolase activator NlpD